MALDDYSTIEDLIDYTIPQLECIATGAISTTRNSGWPRLVELESMKTLAPTLVRETIGSTILQSKTDRTLAQLDQRVEDAIPFSFTRENGFWVEDKASLTIFCSKLHGIMLTSMLQATVPIREEPYAKWHGAGDYKSQCDAAFGFFCRESGKEITVVGQSKLSKDWNFKNVEPVIGKSFDNVKKMKQSNRNPLRQLASNALAYDTCWSFIHTEKEFVLARVYKVRETDELQESLKGYKEYRDAEEENLGIEMMTIPWNQPRGPDTLSALEGLFLWAILSFHDDYRELVFKDELAPMTQVLDAVKLMLQSHL
ncbi:hypothetical protein F5Y18DRAFT_428069 [Xylariaceae sp. FL1019]|nr:hypothetical protein F5Y18DRAFT_428069 [Xylariaceae sp. FL1019]